MRWSPASTSATPAGAAPSWHAAAHSQKRLPARETIPHRVTLSNYAVTRTLSQSGAVPISHRLIPSPGDWLTARMLPPCAGLGGNLPGAVREGRHGPDRRSSVGRAVGGALSGGP